jgi:LysM repeat protein/lysophospholipase L1-like esterase
MIKYLLIIVAVSTLSALHAQEKEQINPLIYDPDFQVIKNERVLQPFFALLDSVKNGSKKQLTVVHIGDSHLQGPYFPRYLRRGLQERFGYSGRGFVFPYRVAQTNGGIDVKFKSGDVWKSMRNVKSDGSDNVGLSGINLEINDPDFLLEMNIDEDLTDIRLLEILSPHPDRFKLSLANKKNVVKSTTGYQKYTVKKGEFLGKIAVKFNTSVSAIQKINGFKNTNINAGQTIKIPVKKGSSGDQSTGSVPDDVVFSDLKKLVSGKYHLPSGNQQVYLRAAVKADSYVLDGMILSNETPGILYHAIGVNGTKFSDYTKFPRFFDQLAAINPDLIIISLGTNESFYTSYKEADLQEDMDLFNRELLERNLTGSVILTSPPPSMKNRKTINSLATAFSYEMGVFADLNSWAFYDLHSVSRTSSAMPDWYNAKLSSSDRVHFVEPGYRLQAQLLLEALFKSYDSYRQ